MTGVGAKTPTSVRAQAAHWFARMLDPDCSALERAAFERWHAADPAHAAAYLAVQGVWDRSDEVVRNDHDIATAAWHAFKFRVSRAPGRRGWLPWAVASGVAAGVAIVAVLVLGPLWNEDLPPQDTQYATAIGEQRTIALADDSVLILDTGTVLVERYSPRERRVELRQGQAEFQVQGDPQRPFVVHAPAGTVTAVGTRFQVRVEETATAITLLEGEVRVASSSGNRSSTTVLESGQRVVLNRDGRLGSVESADLRLARDWTEGRLFVDDWPLQELVAEINRYSDVQLRIDDPELRQLRIRGMFRTHDRGNLAKALEQGWGIHAQPLPGGEVLLTRQ